MHEAASSDLSPQASAFLPTMIATGIVTSWATRMQADMSAVS